MLDKIKNVYLKKIAFIIYDAIATYGSGLLAALLIKTNEEEFKRIIVYSFIFVAVSIITFAALKLYDSLWRYASVSEIIRIIFGVLIVFIISASVMIITNVADIDYISIRWCITATLIQFVFVALSRYSFRLIRYFKYGSFNINRLTNATGKNKVMIVGAGDAGVAIIKEIDNNPQLKMCPVCIIDDDEKKGGSFVSGVKVVGTRDDIPEMAAKYNIDTILVTMPSATAKEVSRIINICQDTKCKIQTLPGMYQLVDNKGLISKFRNVEVQDLLGREQIVVDIKQIESHFKDQVVLVTGGGGSIGSELCRQIARSNPKQLIIVDFYENNAYDIEQELKHDYPNLNLVTLIANVCDEIKMDSIFATYRPDLVFHAAAHKHVPLMETSPNEAIKNNVGGAVTLVKIADKYHVKKVLQISTDKAVNPTNVMGASKRICEMVIQEANSESKDTDFVAVRFGNVLGSNGSVIPLFKKQIAAGGPVTVTDRNITRFFMTIPEAVSLVLQAGVYAKGGEIFVLDMGEPVKIYDLAVNLIRLSGYTPNVDIKIDIVGLRPGEKLYEELLMSEEGLESTDNKLIHIGKPIEFNKKEFATDVDALLKAASNEEANVKELIKKLVPTYHIPNGEK